MRQKKTKSAQLQIRISPEQKRQIENRAKSEGYTVSEWILKTTLDKEGIEFRHLLSKLEKEKEVSHSLAALHDFLIKLPLDNLEQSLPVPSTHLSPLLLNMVAAMIEKIAMQKGVKPPNWVTQIIPLKEPYFATSLNSLKLHLLVSSPVSFRKRNLFVDSSVGDRV